MKKIIGFLALFFAMVATAQAQKLCGTWQQRGDTTQDGYISPDAAWRTLFIMDECTTSYFSGHLNTSTNYIIEGEIADNGTIKMVCKDATRGFRSVSILTFIGRKTLRGTYTDYQNGVAGATGDIEYRVLD